MDNIDFLQRKFMTLGVEGTISELASAIFTEDIKNTLCENEILTEDGKPNLPFIHSKASELGFE